MRGIPATRGNGKLTAWGAETTRSGAPAGRLDIADIAAKIDGRCVLFGNIDAIGVLQDGSEDDLRREIARQATAGRRNGNRFVLSTGSPITPGTPVERVRLYTDLARGCA